jgi:hypothetical protein
MRRRRYLILASVLSGLGSAGCGTFAEECFNGAECSGVFGSGGASATTSSTMTSSTGTGGTTSGCDPTDSTFVSDACGVFVALEGKDRKSVV